MTYNPPDHDIVTLATQMQSVFERRLANIIEASGPPAAADETGELDKEQMARLFINNDFAVCI
jgi:hypothetical protein